MSALAGCAVCGELLALHSAPCDPGVCVSAGCTRMIVDSELAVCGVHLAMVKGQRTSRTSDPKRWRREVHG